MRRRAPILAGAAVAVLVAGGCGKKGAPQPPLRPDPARIADLAVRAVDTFIHVSLTVPAENADGTTPSVTESVVVYALAGAASPAPTPPPAAMPAQPAVPPPPAQPPVTAAAIVRPENLVATVRLAGPVGRAGDAPAPADPSTAPVPSRREVQLDLPATPTDVIRYVAVAAGHGRQSAASPVVEVPIGRRPAAPAGVKATFDERDLHIEWTAPAAAPAPGAHVDEVVTSATGPARTRRSAEAVATTRLSLPVTFGVERCFEVRHVVAAGRATVEGPASAPVCVTPVDTFPPAAPVGVVAIAEDGAVVLTWRAVEATDLAGYLVLRGDGAGETLQPLTPRPIDARSYRDDTVRPGDTYTYVVVAVDRSTPANRSAASERETVVARQTRFR